jgi:hypothetical protein
MSKLSAKNFKAPLLVVLAEMSDWKPDVAIVFKDCYASVCNAMGIESIEACGTQESTGKPWVEQWIGWAFRALKTEELGTAPRRGRWALTEKGLDLARTYANTGVVQVNVPAIPASAIAAKATVEAKATPSPKAAALDFTDIEKEIQGEIELDPYIQSLLVGETKCLGKWSDRSSMCGTCPIVRACKNFMRSELSALAERMVTEEERAKRTKADDKEVDLDELLTEKKTKKSGKVSLIKAALDSVCEECGKKILRGEECYWDTGEGLCHKDCMEV